MNFLQACVHTLENYGVPRTVTYGGGAVLTGVAAATCPVLLSMFAFGIPAAYLYREHQAQNAMPPVPEGALVVQRALQNFVAENRITDVTDGVQGTEGQLISFQRQLPQLMQLQVVQQGMRAAPQEIQDLFNQINWAQIDFASAQRLLEAIDAWQAQARTFWQAFVGDPVISEAVCQQFPHLLQDRGGRPLLAGQLLLEGTRDAVLTSLGETRHTPVGRVIEHATAATRGWLTAAPSPRSPPRLESPLHERVISVVSGQAANLVAGAVGGGEPVHRVVQEAVAQWGHAVVEHMAGPEVIRSAQHMSGHGPETPVKTRAERVEAQALTAIAAPFAVEESTIPEGRFPEELFALQFILQQLRAELVKKPDALRVRQVAIEAHVLIDLLRDKVAIDDLFRKRMDLCIRQDITFDVSDFIQDIDQINAIFECWSRRENQSAISDKGPFGHIEESMYAQWKRAVEEQGFSSFQGPLTARIAVEQQTHSAGARRIQEAGSSRRVPETRPSQEVSSSWIGGALSACFEALMKKGVSCAQGYVEEMLAKPLNPEDRIKLESVRRSLNRASEDGSSDNLVKVMQEALQYYGVLPEPTGQNRLEPLFSRLKASEQAPQISPQRAAQVARETARVEAAAFVSNTKNFATISAVYELFCRASAKKANPLNIVQVMESAGAQCPHGTSKEKDAAIRNKFFKYLYNRSHFLVYPLARFVIYPIMSYLLGFTLRHFTDSAMRWVEASIRGQRDHTRSTLPNTIAEGAVDYCTILLGAFQRIADPKRICTGGINSEMEKELRRPEFHAGMSPSEFYKEVGDKLVDRFFPDLGWSESIQKFCREQAQKAPDSIRFIARGFLRIVASPLSVGAYVLQGLFSLIARAVVKKSMARLNIIETLIDSSSAGLQFNGYTHAFNTLLKDQLEELLDLLEKHYDPTQTPPIEDERNASYSGAMAGKYRENLRALIPLAMDVVITGSVRTVPELQRMYSNSPMQRLMDFGKELCVREHVLENVIAQVADCLQVLLGPEKLQQTAVDALRLVNSSFSSGKQIPQKEIEETEAEVKVLLDRVLYKLIKEEIDAAIDVDATREIRCAGGLNQEICAEIMHVQQELQGCPDHQILGVLQACGEKINALQKKLKLARDKKLIGAHSEALLWGRLHALAESIKLQNRAQILQKIGAIPTEAITVDPKLSWLPGREGIATQAAAVGDGVLRGQLIKAVEALRDKTYNIRGIFDLACNRFLGIAPKPAPKKS